MTRDEILAAAERLRRAFHEDEPSPLLYNGEPEADQIRADVLLLCAEHPAASQPMSEPTPEMRAEEIAANWPVGREHTADIIAAIRAAERESAERMRERLIGHFYESNKRAWSSDEIVASIRGIE